MQVSKNQNFIENYRIPKNAMFLVKQDGAQRRKIQQHICGKAKGIEMK